MAWKYERKVKRPKLTLAFDEALDCVKQIKPFIEYSRKAGMKGLGWAPQCAICGDVDPLDENMQETISVRLLIGERPRDVAKWLGISPATVYKHRTHIIAAFWAFGVGSKIAADGHFLTFPKAGTARQRQEWHRGRFQHLAYQAQQQKDVGQERACLKEAARCDLAIAAMEERDGEWMKRALDVPPDLEAKLVDAERRAKAAIIDQRPMVKVGEKTVEMEVASGLGKGQA
jgi:hypothetical protein